MKEGIKKLTCAILIVALIIGTVISPSHTKYANAMTKKIALSPKKLILYQGETKMVKGKNVYEFHIPKRSNKKAKVGSEDDELWITGLKVGKCKITAGADVVNSQGYVVSAKKKLKLTVTVKTPPKTPFIKKYSAKKDSVNFYTVLMSKNKIVNTTFGKTSDKNSRIAIAYYNFIFDQHRSDDDDYFFFLYGYAKKFFQTLPNVSAYYDKEADATWYTMNLKLLDKNGNEYEQPVEFGMPDGLSISIGF